MGRKRRRQNPRIAAARATEQAAAEGKAWAVKMVADGTLEKLDPSVEETKPNVHKLADFLIDFNGPMPHVREAMYQAATEAADAGACYEMYPPIRTNCPHCKLSVWLRLEGTYRNPIAELETFPPAPRVVTEESPPLAFPLTAKVQPKEQPP